MELSPREAAFLLDEMDEIENDEFRHTSARHQASQIRQKAEQRMARRVEARNSHTLGET